MPNPPDATQTAEAVIEKYSGDIAELLVDLDQALIPTGARLDAVEITWIPGVAVTITTKPAEKSSVKDA